MSVSLVFSRFGNIHPFKSDWNYCHLHMLFMFIVKANYSVAGLDSSSGFPEKLYIPSLLDSQP